MDKFEYKVRADEIKELIARGEYALAVEIADTIDWRRVKSVMMLCTISDLYKINRRYEDARNVLLLAYERRPGGRTICYALCEMCIKTEEFVQAVEYYKEFVQVAPKDPGRYILQYKLYEAQDVSLEERIGVLEELKKRDYREKWAYELAYLYHRVGLATRCVEECDELILWFGDGKYVIKAMELKMLHQPLNPTQQQKYDRRFEPVAPTMQDSDYVEDRNQDTAFSENDDNGGQFDTVSAEEPETNYEASVMQGDTIVYENIRRAVQDQTEVSGSGEESVSDQSEEIDIQVKTMDMGKYNTINLQAELAAGLREVLEDEQSKSAAITRAIVAPMLDTESLDYPELTDEDIDENDVDDGVEQIEGTEVFFGETGEMGTVRQEAQPAPLEDIPEHEEAREVVPELQELQESRGLMPEMLEFQEPEVSEESGGMEHAAELEAVGNENSNGMLPVEDEKLAEPEQEAHDETAQIVMNQIRMEKMGLAEEQVLTAQPPKELAGVLSQESDGQISLVMPERETVEKQITGQMNIQDVLAEWERRKQESQERREEEVRQRVLQQTGNMFTEFDASARDGLLEQLESGTDLGVDETELSEGEEEVDEVAGEPENIEEDFEVVGEEIAEETLVDEEVLEGDTEETVGEPDDLENLGEVEELEEIQETEEFQVESDETEDLQVEFDETEELQVEEDETEELQVEEDETEELQVEFDETEEPQVETDEIEDLQVEPEKTEEPQIEAEEVEEPSNNENKKEQVENEEFEAPEDEGEQSSVEREQAKVRGLTQEEKELFAPYIQSKSAKEQLVKAIDNISLAAYTGNIIITGDEGMDTTTLAKNMIREVQLTDSNFSGKVAKISGQTMNNKNVTETLGKLKNGALIIQKASEMSQETAAALHKELQQESLGIIVVLEDSKKAINKLLEQNKELASCFTARMNVEALSNDMLVAFGRQYAKGLEYSIDDLGVLALHTRIEELQTIDHAVTVLEVKEMVDEAIRHASRKTLGHFVDILMAKRYDEEDMIILTEKDFV